MEETTTINDKFLQVYLGRLINLNFKDDKGQSIHIRCVLAEVSPPFVKVKTLKRESVLRIADIISLSERSGDNEVGQ